MAEEQKTKQSKPEDKKRNNNYFGEEDQALPQNNNHLFDDQKKADIFDTSKDRISKQQASQNEKPSKKETSSAPAKKEDFNL